MAPNSRTSSFLAMFQIETWLHIRIPPSSGISKIYNMIGLRPFLHELWPFWWGRAGQKMFFPFFDLPGLTKTAATLERTIVEQSYYIFLRSPRKGEFESEVTPQFGTLPKKSIFLNLAPKNLHISKFHKNVRLKSTSVRGTTFVQKTFRSSHVKK